ncbi:MAG: phage tail terminator protein [Afipia sp.]
MMLIDEVVARLGANIAALTGRVEYVADLSALVDQGVLPQAATSAFVVPLGFDDQGGGTSAVGIHIQNILDSIGVILIVKSPGDAKARSALPKIDVLAADVIMTIAGWAPDSTSGVFEIKRGRMVSVMAGAVIYQLDFALTRQVRIT